MINSPIANPLKSSVCGLNKFGGLTLPRTGLVFLSRGGVVTDTIGLPIETLYPLVDPALRTIVSADGGTTRRTDADIVTQALANSNLNKSTVVGDENTIAIYAYQTTTFATLAKACRYLKTTWVAPTGPTAFTFTDTTGAELSTLTESAAITVSGLDVAVWFTVIGGESEVNDSNTWVTSGVVINTDTVKVRRTSSAEYDTPENVALNINGVSGTFTITTKSELPTAFVTTWLTTAPNETITLPLRSGNTYNFIVNWGDGTSNTITSYNQPEITHTFASAGTQTVSITGSLPTWYFNNSGSKLKIRSAAGLGAVGITTGEAIFFGCSNLTSIDTSGWNTTGITSFYGAFSGCSNLTSIDASGWNVGGVTTFYYAFNGCAKLESIDTSGWNVASAINFQSAFYGCKLSQQSIDEILSVCVAGGRTGSIALYLNGGTNAPPSASGLANKDILVSRGWTVTVNT